MNKRNVIKKNDIDNDTNIKSIASVPNEIYFSSSIDESSINELIETISNLNSYLYEQEILFDYKLNSVPIIIFFSTPGGVVDDALKLISYFRMLDRKVYLIADSLVASSGVYIYLSVPKENRLSTMFSYFLVHDIKIILPEFTNIKDVLINTEQIYENLKETLEELLKEVKIEDKFTWNRGHIVSDVYLSLKEALDRNFVSKIVNNKNELYEYIKMKDNVDLFDFKDKVIRRMIRDKYSE